MQLSHLLKQTCVAPTFSTGNELTPGVKYDFKFKDYAPWVFRHLRERFRVDAADYMVRRCVIVPVDQTLTTCFADVLDQQVYLV